ncbi:sharpin [Lagopus leucura]|uniref:sharpin n=1 Tax=Lagopus leucura TaxID=30410 RepID=UPI001C6871F1|nr:sharpin [Lagopus leucura]
MLSHLCIVPSLLHHPISAASHLCCPCCAVVPAVLSSLLCVAPSLPHPCSASSHPCLVPFVPHPHSASPRFHASHLCAVPSLLSSPIPAPSPLCCTSSPRCPGSHAVPSLPSVSSGSAVPTSHTSSPATAAGASAADQDAEDALAAELSNKEDLALQLALAIQHGDEEAAARCAVALAQQQAALNILLKESNYPEDEICMNVGVEDATSSASITLLVQPHTTIAALKQQIWLLPSPCDVPRAGPAAAPVLCVSSWQGNF